MDMKTPETNYLFSPGRYLFIPGLATAIVLTAATSSFASLHEQAQTSGSRVAQYCVPDDGTGADAQQIYCSSDGTSIGKRAQRSSLSLRQRREPA
jgi:hypothetical protein